MCSLSVLVGVTTLVFLPTASSAQAHKLNRPLARTSAADSGTLAVSPDGNWLVYGITGYSAAHAVLHSVPLDGSAAPVLLSPPTAPVFAPYAMTPDSQRVVYRITLGSQHALASSPLDGSAASAPTARAPSTT